MTQDRNESIPSPSWEALEPLYRELIGRDNPEIPEGKIQDELGTYRASFNTGSNAEKIATWAEVNEQLGLAKGDFFGDWLRSVLVERGWNQSDLARAIQTRPSVVSKWVNRHQKPEVEQCARIAGALQLSPKRVYRLAGHGGLWLTNYSLDHREQSEWSLREEFGVRAQITNVIEYIPEPLLVPVVTMLRALAEDHNQKELVRQLFELAREEKQPSC